MFEDSVALVGYKVAFRGDPSSDGLMNWSPLRQLNSWFRSQDAYLLRAFIMCFGWRPFLVSGPRPHIFKSLTEASDALDSIASDASLLLAFSVDPALSVPDLFMTSVRGSHAVSDRIQGEIVAALEIREVSLTDHDVQVALVQDTAASYSWYVVYHATDEGHLYFSGDLDSPSWLNEDERARAWSADSETEALAVAKSITRKERYYAYPLRIAKPDRF